jgi:hypothetical protein
MGSSQSVDGHLDWFWGIDCRRSQKISGPRDTSPSQETSVCIWEMSLPSGNTQRGYKNPVPTLTHMTTCVCVRLHSPLSSLSLLFSSNKIFPISVAGVLLCFHSQRGLKNPENLKFLHMPSVHQIWWHTNGLHFSWTKVGIGCTKLEKAA